MVPKKDGRLRFCVDYRKLNAVTKKDSYPLPRIDDLLQGTQGARYFTALDIITAYWSIKIKEGDREKTAFPTHRGLFHFICMPFGLTNAPATFQRLIDAVMAGINWLYVLVYMDDIIVFSRTFEEHLMHLQEVFNRLHNANLKLKAEKCFFCQKETVYLGHVISSDGHVHMDPKKIQAIAEMGVPERRADLEHFLGSEWLLPALYKRVCKESCTSE